MRTQFSTHRFRRGQSLRISHEILYPDTEPHYRAGSGVTYIEPWANGFALVECADGTRETVLIDRLYPL